MNELDLKTIKNPKKVIELGKIKLHLEGVDTITEHYIESVKLRNYMTTEDRDLALAVYISRLIRCSVKKVEGIKLNGQEWNVSFIDSSNTEIDLQSYNVLNKVFKRLNKKIDLQSEIINFYTSELEKLPDGIEIEDEDDKKKD